MLEKILKNKELIAKILCIVAIALVLPELISMFNQNFTDNIYSLLLYASYIGSALYLLILLLRKKELTVKSMIIAVILLFAGLVVTQINNLVEFNNWATVYYIALYALTIIFYLIFAFNNNEKIKIIVYLLFLIVLAFNLTSVFGGSTIGFARLILGLIILTNLYLNSNKEKEEEKLNEEN